MESFCYHGVGENLLKFESIMKNGIVSQEMSEGIDGYTKQFDGYNGSDKISVVIPHEADEYWQQYIVQADSLGMFVLKGGISFKIENIPYTIAKSTERGTNLEDEGFVYDRIPKENITGIIVSSKIRDKNISELSFLGANRTEQAIPNVRKLTQFLIEQGIDEEEFEEIEDLISEYENAKEKGVNLFAPNDINFLKKDAELREITVRMDKIIANGFETLYKQKCNKSSVNVMDVVNLYNDRELPIYDENDIVQECKGLRIPSLEKSIEESSVESQEEKEFSEEEEGNKTGFSNPIQESIKEGTFMKKTFGLKRTIEQLKARWNNRNKTKENIYEREG